MDTGADSKDAQTSTLLIEQKQLFCKLLLLEIEKYEQSLNRLNRLKSMREEKKEEDWNGFGSLEEVERFGRNYYHGVLESITTHTYMVENSAFEAKYLHKNLTYSNNGMVIKGREEWTKAHNNYVKNCKQCYLVDFNITSWIPYSFSASYTISIIFVNNVKMVNEGHAHIVMNKNRKQMLYVIETSTQESYQQILKIAATM